MEKIRSQFGSWSSPISSDLIVNETVSLGQLSLDGEDIYWIEGRPSDGGRQVLVKRTPDGNSHDITPDLYSCRSLVHEYGGASYLIANETVYFSNYRDQRIYRQKPPGAPIPITPSGELRYADGVYDHKRNRIIYILEDHSDSHRHPVNGLVSIDPTGIDQAQPLVTGNDFYSSPRINPKATQLAWITWNHPNMPWDGTELWVADLTDNGLLENSHMVFGGETNSILEPSWSPNGVLHFVSDTTGWWNLYKLQFGKVTPLWPLDGEFTRPPWSLGMSTYGYLSNDVLITAFNQNGIWKLAKLDTRHKTSENYIIPYTEFGRGDVRVRSDLLVFQAASTEERFNRQKLTKAFPHQGHSLQSYSVQGIQSWLLVPPAHNYYLFRHQ